MKELIQAFRDLKGSPRGFWLSIFAFAVDSAAYFGVLTLMTTFMHDDIGLSDGFSSICVSIFTGLVTLFMLGVGGAAEKLGIRKGLILALALAVLGRFIYAGAPFAGDKAIKVGVVLFSLLVVAVAEGINQPLCYAGVKQYTNEKTSSMGYAMLYAMMNLGIVLIGLVSPLVRVPMEERAKTTHSTLSGVNAVNLVCVGVSLFCLLAFWGLMTKKAEANVVRPTSLEAEKKEDERPALQRLKMYFVGTKEEPSPFRDARFVFFIFMLLPVRTLFAHQWLTLPAYVLRAYPQAVSDKMEWIVNWVNPGIIFFGVPTITALTRKYNVYTMMIIGTAVSALPTFLLVPGPSLFMLITYLVIFSIGEALWSARFYEYASELAPEGRVAQYMGLSLIPWLLAKSTTGLYSGAMLGHFVPEKGPQNSGMLWLIYGLIGCTTPIGLMLARSWVMKGLKGATPKEKDKPAAEPAAA
jgi:MFS family permease